MLGLEEDDPEVEVRNGDVGNHGLEWRSACSLHAGQGSRWHRWQGRSWLRRDLSGGPSSSWDGSSNWRSDQGSQQSTMMRVSRESNWSVWAGRGLRVKVNLLIFKDKKTKDVVTYHSWQWDVVIFCCSSRDDHTSSSHCRGSQETWPGV